MKKLLSIVLLLMVVVNTFCACQNKFKPSDEFGFDNLEVWKGELVEIQIGDDQNFVYNDDDGSFVILKEGTGFYEFYQNDNQYLFSSIYEDFSKENEGTGKYNVLDNNTITLDYLYGNYTITIVERIAIGEIIIFKTIDAKSERYYMPFKYVDTEKKCVYYKDGTLGLDCYKMYLKYELLSDLNEINDTQHNIIELDSYSSELKLGFANFEEWNNQIVMLSTNEDETFVFAEENMKFLKIRYGARSFNFDSHSNVIYGASFIDGMISTDYSENMKFDFIDNDSISVMTTWNGKQTFKIVERIQVNDLIVMKLQVGIDYAYFLPLSFIYSNGVEQHTDENGNECYIIKLK